MRSGLDTATGEPLVRATWQARLCAVGTGLLYFLAFPGIDLWPLGFVAWLPLLLAMRGRSVRAQTGLAWLSGLTMTFVGFYWMLGMLQTFSGFPVALCVLFMLLLAADQGCRIETDFNVHIGERLQIAVPRMGQVKAQVRWALPGAAGTRFLTESDF